MKLTPKIIDIDNILLDPNNPRFFDIEDHQRVDSERYTENIVQEMALNKLLGNKTFDIVQLKDSLKVNGYVPLEKVVVRQYDTKYALVIEGNRRIAAIKSVINDYFKGIVIIDEEVIKSLEKIEVLVLEVEAAGENINQTWDELIIQGIRHISGTKEWGAYQKARFIVSLKDQYDKDFSTISSSLGLGPRVTTRYYKTFKALKQMMDDETYGEFARPSLFTHFEEMIKSPNIKEWLGWDVEKCVFCDSENLEIMHSLISETINDDGEAIEPKLPAHTDVRNFSRIIHNKKAKSMFLSGSVTLGQALVIANPPPASPWQETAKECLKALENLKISDMKAWTHDDSDLLDKILEEIEKVMKTAEKIREINEE